MDNFFSAAAHEQKLVTLAFKPGVYAITLDLSEPNSEIDLRGTYTVANDETLTITIIQHHRALRTKSSVFIKGIADGQSRVDYHGTIIIEKEAYHTQASQFNKNLILSSTARVTSSPNLEIHTNQVQCKHGSAVGKLNAEHIFYLQSRGFSAECTRKTLIDAFLGR